MATWPDINEIISALGNVHSADDPEIENCRLAAIDRLTALCVLDETVDPVGVPDAVRRACILLTSRLFARRSSPEGVAGFGDIGAVRISGVDVDVMELVASHRRWGVA